MKKWEVHNSFQFSNTNFQFDKLINILLENRGIKTKKEKEDFLNPGFINLTAEELDIDTKDLIKSIKRINDAIKNKEKIIIFGDYDVDGICGTAILWESLNAQGADVMPYIPHRTSEGYGLSKKGIENVLKDYADTKLIITVDNGIVANEAVDFGNKKGLQIIITDHHLPEKKIPDAFAIVHSTKICGAAVGWFLSQKIKNKELEIKNDEHLGLVALATVTDVMSLTGYNRMLVRSGLKELQKTKRPGIIELLKLANVEQEKIGVYELGHIIGPRLNAMGRIEHAMDSLRFLCTNNLPRAKELATKLHLTNRDRQQLTFDSVSHAKKILGENINKLIFLANKNYQPGVIGLISGRLTEEFYKPSIVLSIGAQFSKGSARSVSGFNIIEFIRNFSDLLVDKGGHPMAAGFTVESKNIEELKRRMEELAEKEIDEKLLIRKIKIDCELPINFIDQELFANLNKLSPFGYGNPEPIFLAKDLIIKSLRQVGADGKHLKIKFQIPNSNSQIDGIFFSYDKKLDLKLEDKVNAIYAISQNVWNGNSKLELKIKDIK